MGSAYADLGTLKSASGLNMADRTHDGSLRRLLEAASGWIDGRCGRHFNAVAAQRRFDGNGGTQVAVPDLVSVGRLRTRAPGAGWEEWPAESWLLYPLDAAPHTRIAAAYGGGRRFPAGMATVEVTGVWGYGSRREDTGLQIASGTTFTVGDTEVTLSPAGDDLAGGHTIRIDDEDLYIAGATVNGDDDTVALTVQRGVNGSRAAAHAPGARVWVYRYPAAVTEACRRIAAGWWLERTLTPFPAAPGGGPASDAGDGVDAGARALLEPFRRRTAALGA